MATHWHTTDDQDDGANGCRGMAAGCLFTLIVAAIITGFWWWWA